MRRRQIDRTQLSAVLLSIALTVSIVGVVALAPVAADSHTKDEAPQMDEEANFRISAVSQSDHYPGDQNEGEGSMRYSASGADAFTEQDAEEGLYIDYIIIDADWIDYSECTTENTAAFGIDRGDDDEGTEYDEDLVQKQKEANFRDDGITVEFYNWEDLGGDPPYMAPEDAIVAQQGEGSAGGPCMTMTSEPGWYRIDGFLNGTVADNGQGEQPSEDAEQVGVRTKSTYFYVCECDSDEEAREQLGPPPNEEGSGDASSDDEESTPAPTEDGEASSDEEGGEASSDEETATESSDGESDGEEATSEEEPDASEGSESTAEEAGDETGDETETGDAGDETGDETETGDAGANETAGGNETVNASEVGAGNDSDQPGQDGEDTPSADDGPGFGALVAILALLGSALLLSRRE